MVFGLMKLGLAIRQRLGPAPEHRILINEISDRDGGKQTRHTNHQMGLDVDLGFYAIDLQDNPVQARWLQFDRYGVSPKKALRFDDRRNWILLSSILENDTLGEIRAILLADWLRDRLLTHAKNLLVESDDPAERRRLTELIQRANDLLRQPKSSPHDDHFHLSLQQ